MAKQRKSAGVVDLRAPDYVVLGMVRLGGRSGYEIKRTVESSIRFFWTVSHAQIYPSLQRLERSGLVLGRSEPRGKRPRRVFEITAAGEAALRDWLGNSDENAFELRDVGMLRLFFADALDSEDALCLLAAVTRRSSERVSELRAIQAAAELAADEGNRYPLLTLRMGVAFHQAMIDTCTQFADETRAAERATPGRAYRASVNGNASA